MMLPYVAIAPPRFQLFLTLLRTDYVLIQDKSFKKFAKAYADSEEVFFKE
jgi:hypothetical protein